MESKDLRKPFYVMLGISFENEENRPSLAEKRFKAYDHYKTKSNTPENKREALKLFFGSLLIFTVLTSFIALLIML
jgi:hypothetical protein